MNKALRFGNFTSSEIGALMKSGKEKGSFGTPALTYINERNMERRLGRALKDDTDAKACDWGHVCEEYVLSMLGLEYSVISKQTIVHPDHDFWCGTPDSICYGQKNTVVDVKSPFTLKSFCTFVDAWERGGIEAIRNEHKDGDKFYYQIVSNACLTGCNEGELVIFCPYERELDEIRNIALMGEHGWMQFSDLPFLVEGNHYKNLNKFRFPIPEADKIALHNRVVEAGKMLVDVPKMIVT
jgi:hypothetical protein